MAIPKYDVIDIIQKKKNKASTRWKKRPNSINLAAKYNGNTCSVVATGGNKKSKVATLIMSHIADNITEVSAIVLNCLVSLSLGGIKYKSAIPPKAYRLLIPLKKVTLPPLPKRGNIL